MGIYKNISDRIAFYFGKLFVNIYKVKMVNRYKGLKAGRKFRVSTSTFIDYPAHLTVEDHVYIGHHCFIEASNGIKIGEGCQITNFVTITSHSSHDAIRYYGKHYNEKDMKGYVRGAVNIGKYTFVGPYSLIMPGTTIGKGCIVAAYSYLKGDYPDFSIIKGNPAKVVGSVSEKDKIFLDAHPELKNHYKEWAEEE